MSIDPRAHRKYMLKKRHAHKLAAEIRRTEEKLQMLHEIAEEWK